jgi:hypothetical protein
MTNPKSDTEIRLEILRSAQAEALEGSSSARLLKAEGRNIDIPNVTAETLRIAKKYSKFVFGDSKELLTEEQK